MDDLAEFKQTYFQECEDLLADLEEQLTALQSGETDEEILHAAFRAIHAVLAPSASHAWSVSPMSSKPCWIRCASIVLRPAATMLPF